MSLLHSHILKAIRGVVVMSYTILGPMVGGRYYKLLDLQTAKSMGSIRLYMELYRWCYWRIDKTKCLVPIWKEHFTRQNGTYILFTDCNMRTCPSKDLNLQIDTLSHDYELKTEKQKVPFSGECW